MGVSYVHYCDTHLANADISPFFQRFIYEELQLSPWNISSDFIDVHKRAVGGAMMKTNRTGRSEWRGRGLQFSTRCRLCGARKIKQIHLIKQRRGVKCADQEDYRHGERSEEVDDEADGELVAVVWDEG